MIRFAAAALLAFVVAGCGQDATESPAPPESSATTKSVEAVDPYDVYLDNAPEDAPELSREDAQTRALLGCEQEWAPGTVDAVLADAYRELCDSMRSGTQPPTG